MPESDPTRLRGRPDRCSLSAMSPSEREWPASFVKRLRSAEEWPVVTRWRFELLLDRVAARVTEHLQSSLDGKVGCSLLYLAHGDCYLLGGSSSDRRRMDREARYYDMAVRAAKRSLTGTVISLGVVVLLDDISRASSMTSFRIEHRNKNCELEADEQKAFLAIPCPTQKDLMIVTEDSDPGPVIENRPDGVIRFTFSEVGTASRAIKLLPEGLLREISDLLRVGREKVAQNRGKGALALAELSNDLLSYRHSEYQGLDQLAFHLQTHYDDCECSIFLGKRRSGLGEGRTYIDLYLAATTALTPSAQHRQFREVFLEGRSFYTCIFDSEDQPVQAVQEAAKTERAYYDPAQPLLVNENLGSANFPGKGEIELPKEYMGFAIPSPDVDRHPYGVIRLVRYTDQEFTDSDRRLAQATTRYLRSWLNLFPLNEELTIDYRPEALREELLFTLFDIPPGRGYKQRIEQADREFTWLLQKIFHRSSRVIIKHRFSGRSGSLALLVENDHGLDMILKCEKKEEPWSHSDNDIRREVDNYHEYVEGKLELNHNIIFRELVRETQWLVGFATSFLHSRSRNRLSISAACADWEHHIGSLSRLERALAQVFEKLILEVWAWWYRPDQVGPELRESARDFLVRMRTDRLFGFLENLEKFDERVLGDLRQIPGFKRAFRSGGEYPPPSALWEEFSERISRPDFRVTWREAVTHGDAHGDNIFFDPQTMDLWVIDFARTGWRPDIFDLALIECDLKFKQLPSVCHNLEEIGQPTFVQRMKVFERDLARQTVYDVLVLPQSGKDQRLGSIGKLVTDVRQLACQGLRRRGDFTDYRITLFLLAFKYMKIQRIPPQRRLLAYLSARELLAALGSR